MTADAMICQKEIAEKITERKADYVLALKDNKPALKRDVADYFLSARQSPELYHNIASKCTLDKDHGRIEKREYSLTTDISWLEGREEWNNLRAIGMVRSEIESGGNLTSDTKYFITSLTSLVLCKF